MVVACYATVGRKWQWSIQSLRSRAAVQMVRHRGRPASDRSCGTLGYENLLNTPQLCSHVIAIGCKRSVGIIPELEEIAAVSCAVQNIYLSLDAYGIGGYWSTGGITFMKQANELIGLGPEDIFMGFFFLGYVQVPSVHRTQSSLDEKVNWIRE